VMLARRLADEGFAVTIHDPMAADAAARVLGPSVANAVSPEEALRGADIAIITTPWPVYRRLGVVSLPRRITIIDCWRLLRREEQGASIDLVWMGYGETEAVPAGSS
jgi:predicted dinucleotide-binding enzyme